jgi:hypothetical protein
MKFLLRSCSYLLLVLFSVSGMAQQSDVSRDARAVEVLKHMSSYIDSLESSSISGASSSDARMDEGLIISNTQEITIFREEPGSMSFSIFDGVATKNIYIHEGKLTVFDSATESYANADVPKDLDAALLFALDRLNIDLPLMDLIMKDAFSHIVGSDDTVLYLSDKSRVDGTDCHHLVIRTPEVDVQIWVQEGEQPLPRRVILTYKWDGGAPRFVANMDWEISPDIDEGRFVFKPPQGAAQIEFIETPVD